MCFTKRKTGKQTTFKHTHNTLSPSFHSISEKPHFLFHWAVLVFSDNFFLHNFYTSSLWKHIIIRSETIKYWGEHWELVAGLNGEPVFECVYEKGNVCVIQYICLLMDIVVQHAMIKQMTKHMFLMFNYILMEILLVLVVIFGKLRLSIFEK